MWIAGMACCRMGHRHASGHEDRGRCCSCDSLAPHPPQIERIRTLSECAQQLHAAHDKEAGRMLGQARARGRAGAGRPCRRSAQLLLPTAMARPLPRPFSLSPPAALSAEDGGGAVCAAAGGGAAHPARVRTLPQVRGAREEGWWWCGGQGLLLGVSLGCVACGRAEHAGLRHADAVRPAPPQPDEHRGAAPQRAHHAHGRHPGAAGAGRHGVCRGLAKQACHGRRGAWCLSRHPPTSRARRLALHAELR